MNKKIKDATAHEVIVYANQALSELGKNNSIGKYDKIINQVKYEYGEGFLSGNELKEKVRQRIMELLKKSAMDSKVKDATYQVSFKRKGEDFTQSNLVKANSENEAKEKFINYYKKSGYDVEILGIREGGTPHFGEPVIDSMPKYKVNNYVISAEDPVKAVEIAKIMDSVKDSVKDAPLAFKSNLNFSALKSNVNNYKNNPANYTSLQSNLESIKADIAEWKDYKSNGYFKTDANLKSICRKLANDYIDELSKVSNVSSTIQSNINQTISNLNSALTNELN